MKKAIISFGRMNPPTQGHEKLVNKIKSVSKSENGTPMLFLSHSQDKNKNPLTYENKIKYTKKAFGNVIIKSPAKTLIQVMKELDNKNYSDIVLIVGSDRVSEFEILLNKYNDKEYSFNSIKVISAGERDPDAEGVEGMSASKLRLLAKSGDQETFMKGLPSKLSTNDKIALYNDIRRIVETIDLEEKILSLQQRQKRRLTMRRIAPKIARMKKIKSRRMADKQSLLKRARKAAILIIKKRIAGEKGGHYNSLSTSEKIAIDRIAEKRLTPSAIDRIAKKLYPKIMKKEIERLRSLRKNVNETFESFIIEEVSVSQIKELEKFADRLLDKFGVDVEFTKHFADRMNDSRNNPPIKVSELQSFFKKIEKNKAKNIKANPNTQVVLKDIQKDLNLPVVIDVDSKGDFEIRHKTIMRKKNFTTPNKVITYENLELDEKMNSVEQDPEIKNRKGSQPKKYYTDMKKSTKEARAKHFERGKKMDDNNPSAYKPAPGDKNAKTKVSKHTIKYKEMYGEELSIDQIFESYLDKMYINEKAMEGLKNKSEKSGISYDTLKKVYDRGLAAWRTGHRPGTTPQQWAYARVNSFISGGKTRQTADADLAKGLKENKQSILKKDAETKNLYIPKKTTKYEFNKEIKKRDYVSKYHEEPKTRQRNEDMQNFKEWALENPKEKWHSTKNQRVIKLTKKDDMHHPSDPKDRDTLHAVTGKARLSSDDLKYAHGAAHRQGYKLHVEEHGAGEEGTKKLTKRYKKDTPGQIQEIDMVKNTITRHEKQKDDLNRKKELLKRQHDSELDNARLRDVRTKNRETKPDMNELFQIALDTNFSEYTSMNEAGEYQGKKVTLNKPTRSDNPKKKYMVYVNNEKGNVVKVHFGDPNMEIKRDNPNRRKSFRARHGCDVDPGPKWKAKYWACKFWQKGKSVTDLMSK